MIEQSISLERMEDTASLFGPFDENIRLIERELHVQIVIREEELRISGEAEQVMYAEKTIQSLLALGARGEAINEQNIRYVLQLVLQGQEEKVNDLARDVVCVTAAGKPIKAKTSVPSRITWSLWAWGPPVPARPIWRWPWRWPPLRRGRSTASS